MLSQWLRRPKDKLRVRNGQRLQGDRMAGQISGSPDANTSGSRRYLQVADVPLAPATSDGCEF